MKRILFCALLLALGACASNPNKAKKVNADLESAEAVGAGQAVGVNTNNEMVFQNKIEMADYLKRLQYDVFESEEEIYGNPKKGNKGKRGVLHDCLLKLRSVQMGGEGTFVDAPEEQVLTRKEEKLDLEKMGVDKNKKLVAVEEDYLKDRIKRFEGYKDLYRLQGSWYDREVKKCQTFMQAKTDKEKFKFDSEFPKSLPETSAK